MPEQMAQVLQLQKTDGIDLRQAEQEIIGYDHIEVGGELLKKWNLPPQICGSVLYQLNPENAPEKEQSAAWVICLANEVVAKYFAHNLEENLLEKATELIDVSIWQKNKLDPSLLAKILEKSQQQFESSKDVLLS
jgi:HD-like signal output (HDOD) protein